ncbi:uncharacterized protein LOC121726454 [Aricia agestis]|uniref:uncharacterized protein LOC121726454 n=1 Tax=Aricia agestis TaxID=91739 RepID=UPI001C20A263|nr:uncharacterized protein LOC121726454 [Aricia agestis]
MSSKNVSIDNMVARTRNKALSCSTPEHYGEDSPSRDSDSIYDSDRGSPVPFLCTQDGAEGETDVVWNFYTPKCNSATSHNKNSTPLSRKGRKVKPKLISKSLTKQKIIKPSQKQHELYQELLELNRNVHEYITKKPPKPDKPHSEEDIFSDNSDSSPKSILRPSMCLRKNVLSSKFGKSEPENGLESDDSMNECLLKASQIVEENVLPDYKAKRPCLNRSEFKNKTNTNIVGYDSMDSILNNIELESPSIVRIKKCETPKINNDSFDNLLEDLNDSALERLSQVPLKKDCKKTPLSKGNWTLKELVVHDSSPRTSVFSRHNSMPESPTAADLNKPSTSGTAGFGRHKSMPFNKSISKGDSPIKCSPDEIERKRKQAREKLLAKRLLPFTQQSNQENTQVKRSTQAPLPTSRQQAQNKSKATEINNASNIKCLIEKKRQEALLRLRKRLQK